MSADPSSDPTLQFFRSGGTAQPSASQPSADRSSGDPTLDFFRTGRTSIKDEPARKPSILDRYVGFQEGQISGLTGGVGSLAGGLSYLGRRLEGGSEDEAQKERADTQSALTYQPRTPEGQKQAAGMGEAASYLGEKPGKYLGGKAADLTTSLGGSPEAAGAVGSTVETATNIPQFVAGEALGKLRARSGPVAAEAPISAPPPRTPPPIDLTASGPPGTGSGPPLTASGSARVMPQEPAPAPTVPLTASGSARAAPYTAIEGPPVLPKAVEPPKAPLTFEEDQPHVEAGKALPVAEQQRRADVLRRTVGDIEVRKSALTGDAQAAADEYQSSQLNSAGGQHLSNVLQGERTAIAAKADQVAREQGGTPGSPDNQTVKIKRGNNIYAPLEMLQDHFNAVTDAAYTAAREQHGDTPITLDSFNKALHDDSMLTNPDRIALRPAVQAFMNKMKVTDEAGGTVNQAEAIRQYLGQNWSPQNSKYVGALKDALEDDVAKAAGPDVFKAARAARSLKGRVFDDPKGMAQIMDVTGPEGINRKVYPEQLADKILSLPVPQMNHIVSTLEGVTDPAIKPAANRALAELRTHLVGKIGEEGKGASWNANAVTDQMNANSERIQRLLPDKTQDDLADLNEAGHILKKRQGYPGAYVQEHNIVRTGLSGMIRKGAAATGAMAGAMVSPLTSMGGAGLGELMGSKLAGKVDNASSLKTAQQRTVRLSDFKPQ